MTTALTLAVPSPQATAKAVQLARDEVARRLTPERVGGVVDKLLDKADGGHMTAIKTVLDFVKPPAGPAVAVQANFAVAAARSETVLRRLAALQIHVHGPASGMAMSHLLETSLDGIDALLAHEWFAVKDGLFALTADGRRAVA